MREKVVVVEGVTKTFPYYGYISSGIKTFLFNLPKALKAVRKRFVALEDISFEVYKGETFGIIGRNGVGKSTLLGLIVGVLKPDKGKIKVKGRITSLLELGTGFHYELTGRENIILNGVLHGMTRREIMKKMDEIIAFSEIEEFIDQPLKTYSSGMVARLGFSVIVHLDPEILIIDEVLAIGDLNFQRKCLKKILSFKEKGVTILFVSHAMDQIRSICDRVLWIENHRVKMIGNPETVCKAYEEALSNS